MPSEAKQSRQSAFEGLLSIVLPFSSAAAAADFRAAQSADSIHGEFARFTALVLRLNSIQP